MAELQRFLAAPCLCVKDHTPRPEYTEAHHVFPQADQLAIYGDLRDRTIAPLCPTSHRAVHMVMNAILAGRTKLPRTNEYVRRMAIEGVDRINAARAGG